MYLALSQRLQTWVISINCHYLESYRIIHLFDIYSRTNVYTFPLYISLVFSYPECTVTKKILFMWRILDSSCYLNPFFVGSHFRKSVIFLLLPVQTSNIIHIYTSVRRESFSWYYNVSCSWHYNTGNQLNWPLSIKPAAIIFIDYLPTNWEPVKFRSLTEGFVNLLTLLCLSLIHI